MAHKTGDEWKKQAIQMIGKRIVVLDCRGFMGTDEQVKHTGIVDSIEAVPDAAWPKSSPLKSVIWVAHCSGAGGEFKVIVARCQYNDNKKQWEERI